MEDANAKKLLTALLAEGDESEWLEFKENNQSPEAIGQRISALSNMAALLERSFGYLVFGVTDSIPHTIVGTSFRFRGNKVGNQPFKMWLENLVEPRISLAPIEVNVDGKMVYIIRIPAATNVPTTFQKIAYCRVDQATPKLSSRPDLETALFSILNQQGEEERIVCQDCSEEKVLSLLDVPAYYDVFGMPLPQRDEMLRRFVEESFLVQEDSGAYSITLLGYLCFAKDLSALPNLGKRKIRVISYWKGDRLHGGDETVFSKGYVLSFNDVVSNLIHLYRREAFSGAMRTNVDPYSEIALREAVGNMIIHGDLNALGAGPLIEAFPNRIEFTNPGSLKFDVDRILDVSPDAQNHALADFMHRIGIGDERGSGYDKMLLEAERLGSPSPLVETNANGVRVVLFPPTPYGEESALDRKRDIYFHCCLRYLNRTPMTNSSVRERFGLGEDKTVEVSKLIRSLVAEGKIKAVDGSSRKKMEYIPYWG